METGYLAERVRDVSPDRYLSVLYSPAEKRNDLLALYAFDAEVASLRDRVREAMAGEIRLQWWRDAFSAPQGDRTGNPVADALREVILQRGLPTAPLEALLEARVFDLYDDPMPDRTTLEGYLGETRSAVILLAAMILDPSGATQAADAAGHAGCAAGIADILATLPDQRRRGQCYVPADLLSAVGTSREALLAGETEAGRAVSAMVSLGREHLARYRSGLAALPSSTRAAFLPMASVEPLLDAVERLGVLALEKRPSVSPLRRHWLMARQALMRG